MAVSGADVQAFDLASPFSTPRAQRHTAQAADIVSPPCTTPRRLRMPLGPSLLNSSPATIVPGDFTGSMSLTPEAKKPAQPAVSLNDLPVELVQQIHKLADNPALPMTTRYMRSSLTHASPTYIAAYMLHQYRRVEPYNVLTFALRRRIVDIAVAEEMIRIWDYRRGYVPTELRSRRRAGARARPATARDKAGHGECDGANDGDDNNEPEPEPCTPLKPKVTRPALSVSELPKRLFRPKPGPGEPTISPLVHWLFNRFEPPLASHKNYALNRAALNQNYDMVELLLRKGADPNLRMHFPLRAAIEKKDLRLVKLLVEPFAESSDSPAKGSGKKRKLTDRIRITPGLVKDALKNGTPEIVDYFVHEKGAMPPLDQIMALGN